MSTEELCQKAVAMLDMAYVPYSGFAVGAALECEDGSVFTGCNIENAAYGPTNCAERTAVFKAVSEGRKKFTRIAIASRSERFCPPCGVCRQVLAEFSPDMEVILTTPSGKRRSLSLRELLPYTFEAEMLE